MDSQIIQRPLKEINLSDDFFNTLRDDYVGFDEWFNKKSIDNKKAYIFENGSELLGFLFLKSEINQPITDILPNQPVKNWLKIGTFKIKPHGTRLGERFLKKTFDLAIHYKFDAIYVTVFSKHSFLIKLLKKYGFVEAGKKITSSGIEEVLIKDLKCIKNDILLDYPKFNTNGTQKFILSIYPKFHTDLFPDSILKNEFYDDIQDVSHTNSIEKVYICRMDCKALQKGDNVIIYRTKDDKGPAKYRSVVTSVCTIEDIKTKHSFTSEQDYIDYCKKNSVFEESELRVWFKEKRLYIIKMVYNAAFQKRINRDALLTNHFLNEKEYWGLYKLTDEQFSNIIKEGNIYASLIIN
jgi:hypothetical protein